MNHRPAYRLKDNPIRSILKSPYPPFSDGEPVGRKPIDFDFIKFDDLVFAASPKNKPLDIGLDLVKFYNNEI
jgi:hypothetical protein